MVRVGFEWRCGQVLRGLDFLLPQVIKSGNIRAKLQGQTLFQSAAVIAFTAAICQPCMMPRNAKRYHLADHIPPTLNYNFCSGGSMIDRGATMQSVIKGF